MFEGSDPESDIMNRLLGVYWATDITHELDFSDKTYTNEVTGTKFYKHEPFHYIDPNNIPNDDEVFTDDSNNEPQTLDQQEVEEQQLTTPLGIG